GDAGAIGDEEHRALPGHVRHHHVDHTGSTPTGSGGKSPNSIQLSPGAWKSDPHDPLRPNARAYVAYSMNCAGVWDDETTSIASPPESRNSPSNRRMSPFEIAKRPGCAKMAWPPAPRIQPIASASAAHE